MIAALAWRALYALAPMALVVVIVFVTLRIVPGDPAVVALGDTAAPEALSVFRALHGLDRSLASQFLAYLGGLAQGELGVSLISGRPVSAEIARVLPYTFELAVAALLFGVASGLPLGIWAAMRRNRAVDFTLRVLSLLGLSFPTFFIAIVLILIFALGLGWFPVISRGDAATLGDRLLQLVLPAISAGLVMMAYVMRATRASLLDILGEDYMRTAKAKGLPPAAIIFRHALRNALLPIITVVGLQFGLLIGNTVLVEIVFNRPGLGKLIVGALGQRDYALMQGLMILYAAIVTLTSLATDLFYKLADPRVRFA